MKILISIFVYLVINAHVNAGSVEDSKEKATAQKLWHEDDPIVYLYWLLGKDQMWYLKASSELAVPDVFMGAIKECRARLGVSSIVDEEFHTGVIPCMEKLGFELQEIR